MFSVPCHSSLVGKVFFKYKILMYVCLVTEYFSRRRGCAVYYIHYALGAGAGIEARLFTGHEVEHASGTPRFCRPADGDKMGGDGDGDGAYCEVTCSAVYAIATCAGPFLCVQERV
jgi:hypothetical protein